MTNRLRNAPDTAAVVAKLSSAIHLRDANGGHSIRMRIDTPTSPTVSETPPVAYRPLHIAVVTETYPPEVNGVALTVARFVEGLRRRNHHIQLIRPRQGRGDEGNIGVGLEEVLVRGMPIPRYSHLKAGLPARRALEWRWSFQPPELVHIVTEGPLGWSALNAARKLKLPVCSDFRTNFHAYSGHYGVGWLSRAVLAYLRWFHNRTRLTMVPTEALRAELAGQGFKNVVVVSRGVDVQRFHPARRSDALRAAWGAGPDNPVALYVGRVAAEKNLPTLFSAFESMRARTPPAILVVVGDGPALAALRARYPNVVFAGARTGEDLAAHYASGDVFLFPSLTETYGNVTVEAMASGLAVLAYDCAAAAEHIVSGTNGMLAPPGDVQAYNAASAWLASDLPRARLFGAQARRTAEALDWERVVLALEAQLMAAAGSGSAARVADAARRPARAYGTAT
jgi:glycosyltransferase involved in cell wall biosynthesis